jgi:aminoglycoside phosphotransferase (APT) family kinase protein
VTPESPRVASHLAEAEAVLELLSLSPGEGRTRPLSGHAMALLLPCRGADGRQFLLKFFVPPADARRYPPDVNADDYARREGAFYRVLDSIDPGRHLLPAPKTILIDSRDPPRWILLEWIEPAVGPAEEILGVDHVFDLLRKLQDIPLDVLLGRRYFPLCRWDAVSYVERVRMMYDAVLPVIGDRRWRQAKVFFDETLRWIESRPQKLVHGDFTDENVLVDAEGRPYLVDFERVGVGSEDHDFAWLWIHSTRPQAWKRSLVERWFGRRVGSDRIRAEWGIRAALVYLALRRLRWGAVALGPGNDPNQTRNLALLDAALVGGADLFPT